MRGLKVSRTSHSSCAPSSSAYQSAEPDTSAARELRTSVVSLPAGSCRCASRGSAPGMTATGAGQRLGERRVAEREVVMLDREDVGEIRRQLDGQLDRDRVADEVRDHDVLLQIVGHEALVANQQLVRRQAARRRVAQEERGREVLDLAGRERHRPLAVDGQSEAREEAGVVGVEPVRALVNCAVVGADAKSRSIEDSEGHHHPGCLRRLG